MTESAMTDDYMDGWDADAQSGEWIAADEGAALPAVVESEPDDLVVIPDCVEYAPVVADPEPLAEYLPVEDGPPMPELIDQDVPAAAVEEFALIEPEAVAEPETMPAAVSSPTGLAADEHYEDDWGWDDEPMTLTAPEHELLAAEEGAEPELRPAGLWEHIIALCGGDLRAHREKKRRKRFAHITPRNAASKLASSKTPPDERRWAAYLLQQQGDTHIHVHGVQGNVAINTGIGRAG